MSTEDKMSKVKVTGTKVTQFVKVLFVKDYRFSRISSWKVDRFYTDIIEYISPAKMRRFVIFVCHILHTAFVRLVLECRRKLTSYGAVTLYTSEWWSTFKIKRSILRSLGTKMWKSFLRLFSIKRIDLHQSNTKMIFTRRPIVKCISPAET